MKNLAVALAAVVSLAALPAVAEQWDIDPSHSSANFSVRHLGISDVTGTFNKVAGKVELDPKDPTKSVVEATIDATTINTNDQKRDAHLKSEDFFWTEKHPNLTFKSTKVAKAGKNKFKVTGDLTMRGVTKPVTLDVTTTDVVTDPWGNSRIGATATGTVNRQDYGIKWNQSLDKGGVVVGNDVKLNLNVELVKAKAAAPATTGAK